MGIISVENGSNLYWLGRYAERVYTTLGTFFNYYDTTLDKDKNSYKDFLEKLNIEDKYGNYKNFVQEFLYGTDPFTVNSTFRSAQDNAMVIRNSIGSESLAYMELAINTFRSSQKAKNLRLALMSVMDYLLAYWGSIDDCLATSEAGIIIKCGKVVERLDLYFRFFYNNKSINNEYEKLCHIITHIPHNHKNFCNAKHLAVLVEVLAMEDSYKERLTEVLDSLNKLFEGLSA
ncbi:MAG: alpha-E domain-containing protein [Candidatus Fibromonas sp.]|jgi:uncharacterized alpha-E superfamily protein|nr:alpha-E domain-containing protein [Candidatus Fibromonas sp.]